MLETGQWEVFTQMSSLSHIQSYLPHNCHNNGVLWVHSEPGRSCDEDLPDPKTQQTVPALVYSWPQGWAADWSFILKPSFSKWSRMIRWNQSYSRKAVQAQERSQRKDYETTLWNVSCCSLEQAVLKLLSPAILSAATCVVILLQSLHWCATLGKPLKFPNHHSSHL